MPTLPTFRDVKRKLVQPVNTSSDIHGMLNNRNNCYLNTVVQCLFAALPVTDNGSPNGDVSRTFTSLLRNLRSVGTIAVDPIEFKNAMGACDRRYLNEEQEDAQEFLADLLNTLYQQDNDTIDHLFKGTMLSILKCMICGQVCFPANTQDIYE